jgi:cell volume regulation protein A
MLSVELIILGAALFLLMGIIASKTSEKLGVPVLLLFLLIGMIAGSDGLNIVYFDDAWLAQAIGIVALVFILFDGGISTKWEIVRPVLKKGIALSTAGVFLTALLLGLFATYVLGFSPLQGLLLGAIVSSTDAAAVFAVLRSKRISLKGTLKPLLELESGSNDPMAVFLTVSVIYLLTQPGLTVFNVLPIFFSQLVLGSIVGYGVAKIGIVVINRLRLEYEGLYPVLSVSLILLTYGVATVLGGSGILAVYITGVVMGNSNFIHKNSLRYFHDGLAWLMQIVMFLTMGLLVFPSQLVPIIGAGLLISLFLMVVARPISVFLTLAFSKDSVNEKLLVSWVGLRGSVPIILATFPLLAGVDDAHTIFNLVFFIVVFSVLLQGTTIPLVSRLLRVQEPADARIKCATDQIHVGDLGSDIVELKVPAGSPAVGRSILDLNLPKGILIVTVRRGDQMFIPGGSTVIEKGDTLLVLMTMEHMDKVCTDLGINRL